jgi:uncharacterized membrane protein
MRRVNVDVSIKIMLIILVIVAVYFVVLSVLNVLFVRETRSMQTMMHEMMSLHGSIIIFNLVAVSLALIAGVLVSLWLVTQPVAERANEMEILKRALSQDERAVLDEVRRAGEITQDSLRFRLGWSKAKLSRILTNLDKMNLIQRERVGKTYNVFLARRKPKR